MSPEPEPPVEDPEPPIEDHSEPEPQSELPVAEDAMENAQHSDAAMEQMDDDEASEPAPESAGDSLSDTGYEGQQALLSDEDIGATPEEEAEDFEPEERAREASDLDALADAEPIDTPEEEDALADAMD